VINSIIHRVTKEDENIDHTIICIEGIPFYKSSGINSSFKNTWFPFFGIEETKDPFYPIGCYKKPISRLNDGVFSALLARFFPSNGYQPHMLHQRFSDISALLISSLLGGGLWDTINGKQLKNEILLRYPGYFNKQNKRKIITDENAKIITQDKEVNEWLCNQANIDNVSRINQSSLSSLTKRLIEREKQNILVFNYQTNRSNLGSVMNESGLRRSARLK
jgi:hypothetical protein